MDKFYKLTCTADFVSELLQHTKTKPSSDWISRFSFNILPLFPRLPLLMQNRAIRSLVEEYNAQPIVIRIDPMKFYRFHVDDHRGAALNILLEGTDCQTYFGDPDADPYMIDIEELPYEPNSMYLLNTQAKHAVVNRNNHRYALSIGFNSPLTYEQVKDFCIRNNL